MKTARGILILSLAMVLCLGVMGTGIAGGGNGNRNGNGNSNGKGAGGGAMQGNGTGACIATQLFSQGLETTVTGEVQDVGNYGQGIRIDIGDGIIVQVFGIGPFRYWDDQGVTMPSVGEEISVTGKEVTFSDGTTKIIAFSISLDGDEPIVLRGETGLPLWRGGYRWNNYDAGL